MDPQLPTLAQQAVPSGVWAPMYGAAFVNHCMHPQLQQLAEAQWKLEVSAKLAAILEKLRERFAKSQNVCLCQTWVGADGCDTANPHSLEVTLWADPRLAIVLDPLFQDLRNKSCQGPVFFRNSMPGKVWRSGAVQIVQNLRILPPTLHPRSQLSEEALERLAEAMYIPIYDLGRPAKGQVCVLEVLLSTRATEAMLVADVISFIGSLLTALHLSLANPVQQPVRRSVLCGRRARAPDSDDGEASGGEGAGGSARCSKQPEQQHQQQRAHAEGAGCCEASASAQPGGTGAREGEQQQRDPGAPAVLGDGVGVSESSARSGGAANGVQHGQHAAGTTCRGGTTAGRALGGGDRAAAAYTARASRAVAVAQNGPGASSCRPGKEPGPACSEQPTLPASPSHDRAAARGGSDAGQPDGAPAALEGGAACTEITGCAGGGSGPGTGFRGTAVAIPRKVRKLLEGAMQRTKSVVSVAALSDGAAAEDEDEDENGAPAADGALPGQEAS